MQKKMKITYHIFTITFLFSLLTAFGQEYDKEIIEQNQIKSIKQYSYNIENQKTKSNGLIDYHLFDQNGNLVERYVKHWTTPIVKYNYDSAGNLIEKVNFKPDGTKNEIYTWMYDKKGNIIKHVTYFSWNKKYYTDNYVYNDKNQNIEIYDLNEFDEKYKITTKKFYESGELLEKRFENKEIGLVRIEQYDKCGNLIYKSENGQDVKFNIEYLDSCKVSQSANMLKTDTIRLTENGKELIKITEIGLNKKVARVIDNSGRQISLELYEYDSDSILTHSDISYFNEQGQVIESKTFYSGSSLGYCGNSTGPPPDSKYHFKNEYYENGLKRLVNYYNDKGIKTGYTEYRIETY